MRDSRDSRDSRMRDSEKRKKRLVKRGDERRGEKGLVTRVLRGSLLYPPPPPAPFATNAMGARGTNMTPHSKFRGSISCIEVVQFTHRNAQDGTHNTHAV